MTAIPLPRENYKSILTIRASAVSDFRIDLATRHLRRAGYEVEAITVVPFYKASQYDLVFCCRPGIDMIGFLKVCIEGGKRVVVDLDDDFNSIPRHNPAYKYTGAGHTTYLAELKRLIRHPSVVTTYASMELVNRYKVDGILIPNCWDEENEGWYLPKTKRDGYINIGFTGTATHREDFNIIEPVLKKLLAENPKLRLVIQLDERIYNRFHAVPEAQLLFIPALLYKDYPTTFTHFDILVVPLRDTRFNRAKSDVKLLECGASKTAYVASDLPFYRVWGDGGLIAKDDEWEKCLRTLIDSKQMRHELGEQGHLKALTRTSEKVCNKWIELAGELSK